MQKQSIVLRSINNVKEDKKVDKELESRVNKLLKEIGMRSYAIYLLTEESKTPILFEAIQKKFKETEVVLLKAFVAADTDFPNEWKSEEESFSFKKLERGNENRINIEDRMRSEYLPYIDISENILKDGREILKVIERIKNKKVLRGLSGDIFKIAFNMKTFSDNLKIEEETE